MMSIKTYTETEARNLARTGLIEIVSDRTYTKAAARRRLEGSMPKNLTPNGRKIIIALDRKPDRDGRIPRKTEHLAAWFVEGGLP
jgi:hypothetical protein